MSKVNHFTDWLAFAQPRPYIVAKRKVPFSFLHWQGIPGRRVPRKEKEHTLSMLSTLNE